MGLEDHRILEHAAANMQFDQDEEEKEGVDANIKDIFNKAVQFTPAEYKPDNLNHLVDKGGLPINITDIEKPPSTDRCQLKFVHYL